MKDNLDGLLCKIRGAASPLREVLADLFQKYRGHDSGVVASYIPELAKVDPSLFGICLCTADGQVFEFGDTSHLFTIQSVSKPFVYGLALEDHGVDYVLSKVGVEPSGDAFNAIVLDEASNRPFNPMVNAGAIATADMVEGKDLTERTSRMLGMFRRYCAREVHLDMAVFLSERATGHRNRAIAHLMLNSDMIRPRVDDTLELYFQQCSVLVSCRDLAMMGATLANRGINPVSGETALQEQYVKYLLSLMYTCGMYDFAGEWAFRVGMPAKSGVGGGIVAVVPGQLGIGIFSPRLDAKGNSYRGIKVCEELSSRFGLHTYDSQAAAPLRELLRTRGGEPR